VQVAIFLALAFILIPALGPLGAAIALVSSDIVVQLGVLFTTIVGETLKHPARHALALLAIMLTVVSFGAALGAGIGDLLPGGGIVHFVAECALWLIGVGLIASPLANKGLRERLIAAIPR
jgi:O-antigen/teichoic acid export membrane protein